MSSIARDFISEEPRKFRFKMGRYLASSLTGFIVGVIVASIVWLIGTWYLAQIQSIPQNNFGSIQAQAMAREMTAH